MIKLRVLIVASLAATLFAQSSLQASLVITSSVSVNDGLPTDLTSTVTVKVYGDPNGSQLVNAFGLKLNITNLTGATSDLTANYAGSPSSWLNFTGVQSGNQAVVASPTATSVLFQGWQGLGINSNAAITGSGQTTTTQIGTFMFKVAKTAIPQTVKITSEAGTAQGFDGAGGFSTIGAGFLLDTGSPPPTQIADNQTYAAIGSGTIGAIVAVPEPTSMLLVGVAGAGYWLARRRRTVAQA